MRMLVAILLLTALPGGSSFAAQADDPNATPVFPSHRGNLSLDDPPQDPVRAECRELSRQIEALKGRPLRRAPLQERYRAECEREGR